MNDKLTMAKIVGTILFCLGIYGGWTAGSALWLASGG